MKAGSDEPVAGYLLVLLIRLMMLVLIVLLCGATIQYIWTEEAKRQDYCSQGGIGDGGAYCGNG